MAIDFKSNINLGGLQLQAASIHPLSAAPQTASEGQMYWNTSDDKLFVYDGSNWLDVSGDVRSISAGTGISVTDGSGGDATVSLSHLGLESLSSISSENADEIFMYDTSLGGAAYLSVNTTSGITIDSTNNDLKLASIPNASLANSSITVTSGAGLTTGGTASLGGTVTVDVGAGTGITVNADNVAIKNAGSLSDDTIVMWDSTNGQLINAPIIVDNSSNVVIGQSNNVHNLIISGNLTVEGTTTQVDSNTVNIGDSVITLNADETGEASQDAGIEIERGTDTNVTFLWKETADPYWLADGKFAIGNIPQSTATEDTLKLLAVDAGDTTNKTRYKTVADVASIIGVGNYSVLLNAATRDNVALSGNTYTVTHNLGSKYVMVEVVDSSTFETVFVETARPTVNTVTVTFGSAPTNGDYVCMVSLVANVDTSIPVT